MTTTIYDWAGGAEAFSRLTNIFYGHVKADPLLGPVFAEMSPEHPEWVAQWLGEVFGGPPRYTNERGGYAHMLGRHLGRALTEPQRARWVRLLGEAADEVGLPSDRSFARLSSAIWSGVRALHTLIASPAPSRRRICRYPVGTGVRPASPDPRSAQCTRRQTRIRSHRYKGATPSFEQHIRPLFTDRDRTSMQWAFDLFDYTAVRDHAAAIFEQVNAGKMPCYGPWPPERVHLLQTWIEAGMHPIQPVVWRLRRDRLPPHLGHIHRPVQSLHSVRCLGSDLHSRWLALNTSDIQPTTVHADTQAQ